VGKCIQACLPINGSQRLDKGTLHSEINKFETTDRDEK